MKQTDLHELFCGLQSELESRLAFTRKTVGHSGAKGAASEGQWSDLLGRYLPSRYQVTKGFVIDSRQSISDEIDLVVHDRQYSPFILHSNGVSYIPAESVYAVVEVKQEITGSAIEYAAEKARSVRELFRTSISFPHAGGRQDTSEPKPILACLVALDSWTEDSFATKLQAELGQLGANRLLDLGCAVKAGAFHLPSAQDGVRQEIECHRASTALVFFLFRLIERLRQQATVPALDLRAYGKYL